MCIWTYKCESHSVKHITSLLKYIHTIKATCFSYKEPSSGICIRTDPYLVLVYDWDPNRKPKPDKDLFLYRGLMMAPCS